MGHSITLGAGAKLYRWQKVAPISQKNSRQPLGGLPAISVSRLEGRYFFTSKTLASMVGFTSILAMTSGAGRPLFSIDMGTTMPKGSFW